MQNEKLEADILFYKKWLVWHMIDKADRWHNGIEIASKTPQVALSDVPVNVVAANDAKVSRVKVSAALVLARL